MNELLDLQYFLFISLIIFVIGFVQGHLTGSAIRHRFHVGHHFIRLISIPIAGLFFFQAIIRINSMSNVGSSSLAQAISIQDLSGVSHFAQSLLPQDTFGAISLGLPMTIILLTAIARIRGRTGIFIMTVSLIALGFMISVKYLGLNVDDEVMTWYVLYQFAVPTGVLISTGALNRIQLLLSRIHFPNL